jgi:hypothetical protein
MHTRRTKLRRLRIVAVSGALAAVVAVVLVTTASSPGGAPRLRVEGPSAATSGVAASTTTSSTTSQTATSTSTSTTSTPTTAASGSQEITYQPFTATGAIDPNLVVTSSVTGTCVTGETRRTYRCFGENPTGVIYDPCFVGPHGTTQPLVCPRNPATPDVVEFTATSVTSQAPITTTRPWAMELAGGQVCLFVSAAWSGLGPYDCQPANASTTPADCREPQPSQPSQPWWTAECQRQKTSASPFTPNRVSKIWF